MTTLDDVTKKKAEQSAEQQLQSSWFGWPRSRVCR